MEIVHLVSSRVIGVVKARTSLITPPWERTILIWGSFWQRKQRRRKEIKSDCQNTSLVVPMLSRMIWRVLSWRKNFGKDLIREFFNFKGYFFGRTDKGRRDGNITFMRRQNKFFYLWGCSYIKQIFWVCMYLMLLWSKKSSKGDLSNCVVLIRLISAKVGSKWSAATMAAK